MPDLLHYPVNLLTGEIRVGAEAPGPACSQGMMSDMTESTATPQPLHEPVVVEREGAVATVRLSRPEAMNSLDTPTKEALLAALTDVAGDPEVRCVVLTGSGRAFCVGQDQVGGVEVCQDVGERVGSDRPRAGRGVEQFGCRHSPTLPIAP